jgi:hypothetical protein
MARGTRYLAAIWQAAWDAGDGDRTIGEGPTITEKSMMDLYNNPNVIPSLALDQYPDDMHADWANIARPDRPQISRTAPRRSNRTSRTRRTARTATRRTSKARKRSRARKA